MRTVNIELNKAKLATKRIQLEQLVKQGSAVKSKFDDIQLRIASKTKEVQELETLVQNNTAQSGS